jgi:hypothetical protein
VISDAPIDEEAPRSTAEDITMAYDWDGKRTKHMNLMQSIAIGAVILLGSTFFAVATALVME